MCLALFSSVRRIPCLEDRYTERNR
jgi:hypothetical protein